MQAGTRSRNEQVAHRNKVQAGLGRLDKGTRCRKKDGAEMNMHEAASRWGASKQELK